MTIIGRYFAENIVLCSRLPPLQRNCEKSPQDIPWGFGTCIRTASQSSEQFCPVDSSTRTVSQKGGHALCIDGSIRTYVCILGIRSTPALQVPVSWA